MDKFSVTPEQCKAARAMLDMSREDLANAAGIAVRTLVDFERGARQPQRNNLAAIRTALEAAGVEFVEQGPYEGPGGPGVRMPARVGRWTVDLRRRRVTSKDGELSLYELVEGGYSPAVLRRLSDTAETDGELASDAMRAVATVLKTA
jgi:transcriptional regulator with XRE-family HTH domain